MPAQTEELTDEQKITKLAGWSLRYRTGLKSMIEAGMDAEELDELIEQAEKTIQEDQKARSEKQRKAQVRRKF